MSRIKSPAVRTDRVNFYYQPSMEQIAHMLGSSPELFSFEYVEQTSADTQYGLLKHFEEIFDRFPETREAIHKMLPEIPFGHSAKSDFIVRGERYAKFPTLEVNRVKGSRDLWILSTHYEQHPLAVDKIFCSMLHSTGQATKIFSAVQTHPEISEHFKRNIPAVISDINNASPEIVARNIAASGAAMSRQDYAILQQSIMVAVLVDDLKVKTETVSRHMDKIKIAEELDV